MSDMAEVREAINMLLRDWLRVTGVGIANSDWEPIEAAIVAARPGVDEIYAALETLRIVKGWEGATLSFSSDRSGYIATKHGTWVHTWDTKRSIAEAIAAIRTLIPEPKPEPTWQEDLERIHGAMRDWGSAREAFERIRKRLEQ